MKKPKCRSCGVTLENGDQAFIQDYKEITVGGQWVRTKVKQHLVCEPCATRNVAPVQ